jgi:hypothetical protein
MAGEEWSRRIVQKALNREVYIHDDNVNAKRRQREKGKRNRLALTQYWLPCSS